MLPSSTRTARFAVICRSKDSSRVAALDATPRRSGRRQDVLRPRRDSAVGEVQVRRGARRGEPPALEADAQALLREQADVAIARARVPPAQRLRAADLAVREQGRKKEESVVLDQHLQIGE